MFGRDLMRKCRLVHGIIPLQKKSFRTNKSERAFKQTESQVINSHTSYRRQQKAHVNFLYSAAFAALAATKGNTTEESSANDNLEAILKKAERLSATKCSKISVQQAYLEALHLAIETNDKAIAAHIQDKLACMALAEEDYEKALKLIPNAMRNLLDSGLKESDLSVLELSLKLATVYATLQKSDLAINGYEWVIEKSRENLSTLNEHSLKEQYEDNLAFLGMALDSYGRYLFLLNKPEKALNVTKEAIDISTKLFGETDIRTLVLLNDLGAILTDCGDLDKAEEVIGTAIANAKKSKDAKHSDIAIFWVNLGSIYVKQKNTKKADEAFRNAKKESFLSKNRYLQLQVEHYIAEQS